MRPHLTDVSRDTFDGAVLEAPDDASARVFTERGLDHVDHVLIARFPLPDDTVAVGAQQAHRPQALRASRCVTGNFVLRRNTTSLVLPGAT